jgi:hypothetical protein
LHFWLSELGQVISKRDYRSYVRGCLDHVQKLLNLTFNKCQRFAFGPRKSLGLDFLSGIYG